MVNRKFAIVAVVALALIVVPGCASKKMFKEHAEASDTRVTAVESGVEANQRRIEDLEKDTDQRLNKVGGTADQALQVGQSAMAKASAAEKSAQKAKGGKLLWSVMLTNDDVRFEFGKAKLTPSGMKVLDGLVSKLKSRGQGVFLEIEGHTDSTGSEDLNMKLGWKRADEVRNYLHEKGGLPLHSMNTISHGESRPIADNSSREGREQNRRVVIRVLE